MGFDGDPIGLTCNRGYGYVGLQDSDTPPSACVFIFGAGDWGRGIRALTPAFPEVVSIKYKLFRSYGWGQYIH